jgi:hypothetical protein
MAGDERQLVKWLHSKDPTGKTYLAGTIVPVKQVLPVQEGRPRTAIILASGAAVGWGTADFFGGVSRREASVFVIIAASELAGVIVLIPIIIARGTPLPDSPSMLLACLAGIAVTVELGLICAALSRGKAFITAPVGGLGTEHQAADPN